MTPLPLCEDFDAFKTGSVLRYVCCEQCSREYFYRLERTGWGESHSFLFLDCEAAEKRAASRARAALEYKLERGVDLVPCPACGWYQQNMIPKAKKFHRRWIHITGGCLIAAVFPLALFGAKFNEGREPDMPTIPWPIFLAELTAVFILGIGLLILQYVLARRFDPNRQPAEIRKQFGQSRGMLREAHEEMSRYFKEHGSIQKPYPGQIEGEPPSSPA